MKANSVITTEVVGGILILNVIGAGKVEFDPTQAHPEDRERAEFHGWKQKLSDAAAIGRDPRTGQSALPAEKLAAIRAMAVRFADGTPAWGRAGAGGSTGGDTGLVLRAVAEVLGVDVVEARKRVETNAKALNVSFGTAILALRTQPGKVKTAYLRLVEQVVSAHTTDLQELLKDR